MRPAATIVYVTCNHFRELVSARIDDEISDGDREWLDDHLAGCSGCATYQEQAWALRRSMRLSSVDADDSAPRIDLAQMPSIRTASALQWALFVIGGTLVALSARAVIIAEGSADSHLGRHNGVFGTALGVAMLAVALKPQRAIGLVPLTSTVAVLMAIVAAADLVAARATVMSEAIHVVQFGGLVCLWVISGGPTRMHRRRDALLNMLRRPSVPSWPTS